ncbi:MAG: CinA family protein [Oscillospiraceae bacterium]
MEEKIYEKIAFLSQKLVTLCKENGKKVSTAESCTGGMISAAITSVSGSSSVIELGVCSYSNRIKSEILKVTDKTLAEFSEYSKSCAEEMARGVRTLSGADYAVSTTGVAGPTGDSPEHPVGEVFIAVCSEKSVLAQRFLFDGNRGQVRAKACETALEQLISVIEKDLDLQ